MLSSPHLPLAALSLSGRNLGITLSLLLAAGPHPPRRAGKWVQSPELSSSRAKVLFQAHGGAEPPLALAPVPGAGSGSRDGDGLGAWGRDGSVLLSDAPALPKSAGESSEAPAEPGHPVPAAGGTWPSLSCPGPRCRVASASLTGDGTPAPFHLNVAFSCSQGESVPYSTRRMLLFLHPPYFFEYCCGFQFLCLEKKTDLSLGLSVLRRVTFCST